MSSAQKPVKNSEKSTASAGQRWLGSHLIVPVLFVGIVGSGIGSTFLLQRESGKTLEKIAKESRALTARLADWRRPIARLTALAEPLADMPAKGDEAGRTRWEQSRTKTLAGLTELADDIEHWLAATESHGAESHDHEHTDAAELPGKVRLLVRDAENASELLDTLRRVAIENRSEEVAGTTQAIVERLAGMDARLVTLLEAEVEATEKSANNLSAIGRGLVGAWLAGAFLLLMGWGAAMFRRNAIVVQQANAAAIQLAQSGNPNASLNGCRILLAEDGASNQRLITLVLERAGAQVVVAGDGAEALEIVRQEAEQGRAFQVALVDLQMPVLDGVSTLAQLRQREFAGPIIALASPAEAEARKGSIAAGFDEFIQKPVERGQLIALIDRLRQKSPAPQVAAASH